MGVKGFLWLPPALGTLSPIFSTTSAWEIAHLRCCCLGAWSKAPLPVGPAPGHLPCGAQSWSWELLEQFGSSDGSAGKDEERAEWEGAGSRQEVQACENGCREKVHRNC